MRRFEGKTVAITGGNSGIGLATARRLATEGARVALFGRNPDSLDAAVAEIGSDSIRWAGDVTRADDLASFFQASVDRFGPIHGVFANAGIAKPCALADVDQDTFRQQFEINVLGPLLTVQAAKPHLAVGASIVLTTSSLDTKGLAGMSLYASTKAAARSLARSLSAELLGDGVRVNAVCPGPIQTPIYARMGLPEASQSEMGQSILDATPIGRFGTPDEIAAAAAFLLASESSFVLGAEFAVDGGFSQL